FFMLFRVVSHGTEEERMSERVTFALHEGRPVAVKTARDDQEWHRLCTEARLLGRLALPGLVELIVPPDDHHHRLVTAWVGTQSLATAPIGHLDDVVSIMGAVADTVADLHDRGVAHRRLDGSHV